MSFPAKYKSTCFNCLGPIKPGDLIWPIAQRLKDTRAKVRMPYAHVKCPPKPGVPVQLNLPTLDSVK